MLVEKMKVGTLLLGCCRITRYVGFAELHASVTTKPELYIEYKEHRSLLQWSCLCLRNCENCIQMKKDSLGKV